MATEDYQTDLLKQLANSEYAAQYLKAAFDETLADGNKSAFLLALKNVVDATGEMQTVVNNAHISPQKLSQILSEEENPTLETLTSVLHKVGITLDFVPLVQ